MRIAVAIILAVSLQSCASAPTVMQYFPEGDAPATTISWPAPPDVARLELAGLLIGEVNFTQAEGERDGAGLRLLKWIVGLGGRQPEIQQLIRPQSGLVDGSGRILVTDAGRQAVMVFDESAGRLSVWDDAGDGSTFLAPIGVAALPNGEFLVADAELGRVIVLSAEGMPLRHFGQGIVKRPAGLAVDPNTGHTYICDAGAHDIKVFDDAGRLLHKIGKRGTGPGEFNGPTHIQFTQGNLYVTDTLNARVQILATDGRVVADPIGRRGLYVGNLVRPKGVTTDRDGNVYVVESYHDHLLVFDSEGRFLLPIGGSGSGIGEFFLPAGAWTDSKDRIFVADMFNGRVLVFRKLGSTG